MASIAVGADAAGAPLKHQLTVHLRQLGYTVTEAVVDGRHDRALLVCGTGLGMAIAANKVPGVRAVTAHDPYSAERARKSNNAQVLAMGARVIAPETAKLVLEHWLNSEFEGGRSTSKVEKITAIDERYRVPRPE
jgi:ribose 5-phosphate isomerase B